MFGRATIAAVIRSHAPWDGGPSDATLHSVAASPAGRASVVSPATVGLPDAAGILQYPIVGAAFARYGVEAARAWRVAPVG